MNRRIVISCWLGCFVVLATIPVLSAHVPVSEYPLVLFVHENGQIAVLKRDELDDGDHPEPFAQCAYVVDRYPGPIPGLLEVYETASVFSSPPIIHDRGEPMSERTRERVVTALMDYARHDPAMIPYEPGQPPQTRFSTYLLGRTVVRVGVIASLSTLFALIVGAFVRKPKPA